MRSLLRILPQITTAHVWVYRSLGGRIVERASLGGPVLLLTTIGRRSGRPRTVALGYVRSGRDVIVAGSNGGLVNIPAWVGNLAAHPRAEVQVGQERYRASAEFLEGDEWRGHWVRLIELYPRYEDARRWSGRRVPLIRLRRSPAPSG
jgi:F420H(2)-dependent quinone reductase